MKKVCFILLLILACISCKERTNNIDYNLFVENEQEAIKLDLSLSTTDLINQIEQKRSIDLCRNPKFYGFIENNGKKMIFPLLFIKKCKNSFIYDGIPIEFYNKKTVINSNIVVPEKDNLKKAFLEFNTKNSNKRDKLFILITTPNFNKSKFKGRVVEVLESFTQYYDKLSKNVFNKTYNNLNEKEKDSIDKSFLPRICLLE